MRMQIIKSDLGGAYLSGSTRVTLTQMGNFIREGHELTILDPNGYDMTQETLVKIAFQDVFPINMKEEYVQVMSDFIDQADLLLVIENGGYYSFVHRRSRGAIFNGEYYFDKVERLIKKYMQLGEDKREMLNYVDNLISGVL